jgi:peptidoglycan/LPS O-acetylase OafA/YrhL
MLRALRHVYPQAAPGSLPQALRPDIEGLRALAVLAVIITHVTPKQLSGGFTGVDIFFVISGYLIGRHLLEDIQARRFSFRNFYARRARRIFPALIVVLAAASGCGWLILSPREFASLGRHVAAAALFCNNFLLWSESGYFDSPSLSKPLLHLWSLGIEEQFYLVIPLLLWLGSRAHGAPVRWVAWISAISLVLNELRPVPSFYLLDTRFWELGAGVLLARLTLCVATSESRTGGTNARRNPSAEWVISGALLIYTAVLAPSRQLQVLSLPVVIGLLCTLLLGAFLMGLSVKGGAGARRHLLELLRARQSVMRNAASCAGIVCLGVSLFAVTPLSWPGPQTVLPVLGTALVIAAGSATFVNRLLGSRLLAYIGGISYPLYLWHWPVLVYWRMFEPGLTGVGYLVPLAAAFLLACLTRYLVEDPVRFGRLAGRPVPKVPVWSLAAGLLAMGLLGALLLASGGDPGRFSPAVAEIARWSAPPEVAPWRENRCYFNPNDNTPYAAECTPARHPGVPQILLWGDSHAAELYVGLRDLQGSVNFDIVQWTAAGCPPTLSPLGDEFRSCAPRRAMALRELPRIVPDTVILAGAWELYVENGSSPDAILAAIGDDLKWLRRAGVRHVVLFGPGPVWGTSLPGDLFRYMILHRAERIPERLGAASGTIQRLDVAEAGQAAVWGASYVSILQRLCDAQGCRTLAEPEWKEGRPNLLFGDRHHLTVSGAHLLMESAAREIFPITETATPH